jgi:hypothetical protein
LYVGRIFPGSLASAAFAPWVPEAFRIHAFHATTRLRQQRSLVNNVAPGGDPMSMEINQEEQEVVCHAMNVYLSDLRHEIGKTENRELRDDLHRERDVIEGFVSKCR